MTLSLAWIRTNGHSEELCLASDSRLSGGRSWDCCPKIIELPRKDCAIVFAGDTNDAYPLMIQMVNTVLMYPPSMDRAMDIEDLRGHIIRVFNDMREQIFDLPAGKLAPEPSQSLFIFAGFSYRRLKFRIWTFHFDPSIRAFTFRPSTFWGGDTGSKCVAFAGEGTEEAKNRLITLLRERGKIGLGGLEMEPLEILRDMIREGKHRTIGGPIQLVKVYKHANTVPFGIKWKIGEKERICVNGRPLLDYEAPRYPILDPDTMLITHIYTKSMPEL